MTKKILAVLMGLAMSVMLITPAFAAGLTSAESNLLAEFKTELEYWKTNAGLDQEHIDQYYNEAQNALTAFDTSDEACAAYSDAIKQIHEVLKGSKTRADLYSHVNELTSILNEVGKKFYGDYGMVVTVNPTNKYAKVTFKTKAADGKDSKQSVVADTKTVVKQTGFGVAQTIAVVAAASATLAGAYIVARKKQLFVA